MNAIARISAATLIAVAGVAWAGEGQVDIAQVPYVINAPGSYIVVTDLTIPGPGISGITITANNVSLDLNGHNLIGAGGMVGAHGVNIVTPATDIEVKNGVIRHWGGDGIYAFKVDRCVVSNIRAVGNGLNGIELQDGCVVTDCVCIENLWSGITGFDSGKYTRNICKDNGRFGIHVQSYNSVIGNTCTGNLWDGIYVITGCVVSDDTSTSNGQCGIVGNFGNTVVRNNCSANQSDGISSPESDICDNACRYNAQNGIVGGDGSTINRNACYNNKRNGITAGTGSSVARNTCSANTWDGIEVAKACRVTDNTCDNNDPAGQGGFAGIHATTDRNDVEGNLVTQNGIGLLSTAAGPTGNLFGSNRASGNLVPFTFVGFDTLLAGDLANLVF